MRDLDDLASSPLARYKHGDVKNFRPQFKVTKTHTGQSRGFGGGALPNLSAASRRQASGLDAAIARGQHAAMGDVSDLTEDDGTSSPTILHQADAIRFLERARARR